MKTKMTTARMTRSMCASGEDRHRAVDVRQLGFTVSYVDVLLALADIRGVDLEVGPADVGVAGPELSVVEDHAAVAGGLFARFGHARVHAHRLPPAAVEYDLELLDVAVRRDLQPHLEDQSAAQA